MNDGDTLCMGTRTKPLSYMEDYFTLRYVRIYATPGIGWRFNSCLLTLSIQYLNIPSVDFHSSPWRKEPISALMFFGNIRKS